MPRPAKSTETFIDSAKHVHGDKFDYSSVIYVSAKDKVQIKCNTCGNKFTQAPSHHLDGNGCIHCAGSVHKTTEQFIEKAKSVHGDKYNYDSVDYITCKIKISILCNKCTEFFEQIPTKHLQGRGCSNCMFDGMRSTTEEFIEKAKAAHGDKYNYDAVNYIKAKIAVTIKCNLCNRSFDQTPDGHVHGAGCPFCLKKTEAKLYDWILENYNDKTAIVRECVFAELPRLRFDFYLEAYNLVIELDGQQHFKQVLTWQAPEKTQVTDKKKMDFCIENGLSVIRILQIDIAKDKYDWQRELKECIKEYEKPSIRMLERGNLYDVFSEYYDYEPAKQY